VSLERLTQEELTLYREVLATELSPCGGRVSLEADLRARRCELSPYAARFIAYRVEQNDTREEIAERFLARYGAAQRQEIDVEGSPVLGEDDATVTIVVFSDFLCPHCASASARLRSAVEESGGAVRMVFRNFPLARQRASTIAALAGLAAHRQDRFWALHDLLFENRNRLDGEVIVELATEAGLDADALREAMADPALEAQIRAEREQGERLGVRGTPTIFINGRRHDEPLDRLDAVLEEELARARMNRSPSPPSE
jgi:protein-disulfide isomerase